MNVTSQMLWIFSSIVAVLAVASTVGIILKKRIPEGEPTATIDNLNARINAWWIMVLVVGGACLFGDLGLVVLFAVISFFAMREFVTISPTRRADYLTLLLAFYVLIPFQYWLVGISWYGLYTIFIPVYVFLLLPIITVLKNDTHDFLRRTSIMQWGVMLCVFSISHVPALLTLDIAGFEGKNMLLVLFLLIVVQSSDVLQYIWGKLAGRHKVAAAISPSKTVEGFVGGVLSASLLGAALSWMTPFTVIEAGFMALLVTLAGFLGGLVMSAIKRDRGVKDWGVGIAGHGGMLDRLDSICFSAPLFFHVVRYWW